jgi:hypothetical protein
MLYCGQATLSPQTKTHLSDKPKKAQEQRMNKASPEGNFSSREVTLLKNTTGPTTSEADHGEDSVISPAKKQALEFAARESANFNGIDTQVDGFIGVLGKDLSSVQAVSTNPNILVRQADHLMEAADYMIDGSIADKIAIRQRNQRNLEQEVSRGEDNKDLEVSPELRRQRIVEVLLANRSAREGLLEARVNTLEDAVSAQAESIESYRQFLSESDPAQLIAFDAHFPRPITPEPVMTHPSEQTMTRTEELEAMVGSVTLHSEVAEVHRPRTGQTLLIMASKAIQVTIVKPFKAMKELLSEEPVADTAHTTDLQKVA